MKGQALVEFALILPILIVLLLGMIQVGIAMTMRMQLTHAAQQGAVAGAADPDPCMTAQARAAQVYGSTPDESTCTEGELVELRLVDAAPVVSPFGVWRIEAIGRAVTDAP